MSWESNGVGQILHRHVGDLSRFGVPPGREHAHACGQAVENPRLTVPTGHCITIRRSRRIAGETQIAAQDSRCPSGNLATSHQGFFPLGHFDAGLSRGRGAFGRHVVQTRFCLKPARPAIAGDRGSAELP